MTRKMAKQYEYKESERGETITRVEYCEKHQQIHQELWPGEWLCESCFIEEYHEDIEDAEEKGRDSYENINTIKAGSS